MTRARCLALALAAAALIPALSWTASAQQNQGRDCQTITTCNFKKGGSYRGCLSSYSCRVCRFVPASCSISGTKKRCHEARCTWG